MLTSLFNGTIFGEIEGQSSRGVVFLHGWGRTRADFSTMAKEAVASGYVVASLDLPGFGATPPPDEGKGTDWYRDVVASAISDFVAKFGVERVAIVGHSFGGRVAIKLASSISVDGLNFGADCAGVIVSGVPLFRSRSSTKAPLALRTLKALVRLKLVPQAKLERYRSNHGSLDYRRAEGVMRETFVKVVNEDYSHQLESIKGIPLIFYWGEDDTSAPLHQAQRGVEMVEGGRLIAVSGDHFTFLGESGEVVKELDGLFAK